MIKLWYLIRSATLCGAEPDIMAIYTPKTLYPVHNISDFMEFIP